MLKFGTELNSMTQNNILEFKIFKQLFDSCYYLIDSYSNLDSTYQAEIFLNIYSQMY